MTTDPTPVDKRELILARVTQVLADTDYFQEVYRNKDATPDSVRPCIIILDGNETVEDPPSDRPPTANTRVVMTPEVYAFVDAARPEEIGPIMSQARAQVIKALLTDTVLLGLVGSNGAIRYAGCQTQVAPGRRIEGTVLTNISFSYIMKAGDLP